ncbi:MAG: hypothetical protein V7695_24565 [Sulfitobacter sp.]
MISTVPVKTLAGTAVLLRLNTSAMVRVERHFQEPIAKVLASLEGGMSVETIAVILGEASNDGAGCPEEEAFQLVDDFGGAQAAAVHAVAVIEAAFPQPKDDGAGADGAAAGKIKKPAK